MEVDGGELPESSVPPATTWDGSSPTPGAPRPSDTIEVLGIERLLGQVSWWSVQNTSVKEMKPKVASCHLIRLHPPCCTQQQIVHRVLE